MTNQLTKDNTVTTTLHPDVVRYRARNPQSRAVRHYTLASSSARVRRATCIYCRQLIATCSNEWPATLTWLAAIESHTCAARATYAQEVAS